MSNKQTTVAPAEQASKQVPTIDTPEFKEKMKALLDTYDEWGGDLPLPPEAKYAWNDLVAHIDAQLAGQPAAPVAAPNDDDTLAAKLLGTMDAQVWAKEFCRLNNAADEGMMLAWFANAIMVGYDHAKREAAPVAATEQATEPPHDLTIGEAFKAVGGWMNGGETGYPSFGSMEALNVYTIKMIRSFLAQKEYREGDSVKELSSALNALLTHMGMDEDEWNRPTFNQARAALERAKARAPLATPADAGAGLTDNEITEVVRRAIATGEIIWSGFKKGADDKYTVPDLSPADFKLARAIEREVIARMSTSAAPVTTSEEQEVLDKQVSAWRKEVARLQDLIATATGAPVTAEPVAWMHDDGQQCTNAASKAWMETAGFGHWAEIAKCYNVPLYAAPVSPQPAAQVPSRNDVLEEAARACEGEKVEETGISDDSAYNVATEHCAKAIRKLKGQPAAVHAAKEGGAK